VSLYVTTTASHWYTPTVHLGIKTRRGSYGARCAVRALKYKRVTLREFRRKPCALCLAHLAKLTLRKAA
jgi:hypothetical protein